MFPNTVNRIQIGYGMNALLQHWNKCADEYNKLAHQHNLSLLNISGEADALNAVRGAWDYVKIARFKCTEGAIKKLGERVCKEIGLKTVNKGSSGCSD
eukprot:4307830-Karenia_brevis.AAC.1